MVSEFIKNPKMKLIGGITLQVFDEKNYHILNDKGEILATQEMIGNEQVFISQLVCSVIENFELHKQIKELTKPKEKIKVTDVEKQFPKLALALANWSLTKEPHESFNRFNDVEKALEDILNE
jgi:hypothetical protein